MNQADAVCVITDCLLLPANALEAIPLPAYDGGQERNLQLSQARANNVRNTILAAGISNIEFGAVGRGVRDPSAVEGSVADRYVTFQITILPPQTQP